MQTSYSKSRVSAAALVTERGRPKWDPDEQLAQSRQSAVNDVHS